VKEMMQCYVKRTESLLSFVRRAYNKEIPRLFSYLEVM
jgi:hypothetical protein